MQKVTVQNATVQKTTLQKDTVQNGRSAEMGNVPIVLSSRVIEWHDVQYYFDRIITNYSE